MRGSGEEKKVERVARSKQVVRQRRRATAKQAMEGSPAARGSVGGGSGGWAAVEWEDSRRVGWQVGGSRRRVGSVSSPADLFRRGKQDDWCLLAVLDITVPIS